MNAQEIASALLMHIKPENILGLQHCATRLRFRLKNEQTLDIEAIKAISGVLSVVQSAGQFQVVIGPGVVDVYQCLNNTLKISDATPRLNRGQAGVKLQDAIFNYIAGSLQPLLPALAGAGIIKGLLALLVVISNALYPNFDITASGTYFILDAIGDSVFYFLPILVGFSAAKALGSNPYLGAMIGAAMIHPSILHMANQFAIDHQLWHFLGLPFIPMNYANSLLPILVGIALLAPLERFLLRIIPKSLTIILLSLTASLILIPFMIMLFGPAMYYISLGIASVINFLFMRMPLLGGALLSGSWFLLVTMGLHWGLVPIIYMQYAQDGYSTFMSAIGPSTMAQIGVTIAILIRHHDATFKTLIRPAVGVALLAGITEPILYGAILKFKRVIPIIAISGAAGGAATALLHINAIPAGMGGILSWPGFAGVNSLAMVFAAVIIQLATLLLAMLLTLLWHHEAKPTKA